MPTRARDHLRRDEGFTLVELLISIVILGVIMVPLVSSFVLSLGTTAEANQRTQNSADAQLVSSYFSGDVASADDVTVSNPPSYSNPPAACGATGDVVVLLHWDAGSSVQRYVAYVVRPNVTAQNDLHISPVYELDRVYCENNNGQGPAISTLPLATTLKSKPTLTCNGVSCPLPTTTPPTVLSPAPTTLSMTVVDFGHAVVDPSFSFTVQGTRRVTS